MKQLEDLKNELSQLKVSKISGQGGPAKLSKIRVVRKSIARVLTVYNQTQRAHLLKSYRKRRWKPLDFRPKTTRAIRRRLTKHEASLKTLKQKKKERNFPLKKYALRA